MRTLLLILLYILSSISLYAQNEEYYKNISQRNKNFEIENLPHLDSKYSTLFFGVSAGLRNVSNHSIGDFSNMGNHFQPLQEVIEANLGSNFNGKWFIETGLIRIKNDLISHLISNANIYPLSLNVSSDQFYIPFTVKRQIISLNRVTKNASLNFLTGVAVQVSNNYKHSSITELILDQRLHSSDISQVKLETKHSKNPFLALTGIEIAGNITPRLELIIFGKGLIRENKYLSNTFSVEYADGRYEFYNFFEKSLSITFGLQARFNSKRYIKYSSVI